MKAHRGGGVHWLADVLALIALLIPKGTCPLCLAAGGSLLSLMGLEFLADRSVQVWLLPAMLAIGALGMLLAARRHRSITIVTVGLAALAVLAMGWLVDVKPVVYVAGTAVLGTSIWGTILARRRSRAARICVACLPRTAAAASTIGGKAKLLEER